MMSRHGSWRCISCAFALALGIAAVESGSDVSAAEPTPSRLDLTAAVVVADPNATGPERKAVTMLVEEVEKRTRIRWQVVPRWSPELRTAIVVGRAAALKSLGVPSTDEPSERKAEGYHLRVISGGDGPRAVVVAGNDTRGVMFGVGRLLRELRMDRDNVTLAATTDIRTSPAYALRGHQLGYRPKTNSYDAWTVAMWEQYYRDLIVFGINAIELIPPRSDDADLSPHFPKRKIDMMVAMSRLADDYGLDVWIWYPAMDADYSDPATVAFALKEWGDVFQRLPRIDTIFVPGGDPGHTQPKHLLALLAKQTEVLRRHHPKAQMWLSPQSFAQTWMDEFYGIIQTQPLSWLGGIVFGPQNRVSLPALRAAIPKRYPIRRYPDITHSLASQYAVPDWDVAYAFTENREVINPRPTDYARIFRRWANDSIGFITYSEGCNDDVNKAVWSGLGWDPNADVTDLLRQYARYFIGPQYEDDFAQGLLDLERNWKGPLLTNASVFTTLQRFAAMEKTASPQVRLNWRFQQALYRAYYDAYQRRRLMYETELEQQAMDVLRRANETGAIVAMDRAAAILNRAVTERVAADWRARIFELAEALYQSIRMQLSVPRYQAISVRRGANLDLVDTPLNNRRWIERRFETLRNEPNEAQRLRGLDTIVDWTDPGPGGFYDDLGDPANQPHLVRGLGPHVDPEFRETARTGFRSGRDLRISWRRFAESRYDAPLTMHYDTLDPTAKYTVRVVYAGDRARIQLTADDNVGLHPLVPKQVYRRLTFAVPQAATADGRLTLTWKQEPGRGGSGRGCQVAEVWLIKNARDDG